LIKKKQKARHKKQTEKQIIIQKKQKEITGNMQPLDNQWQ
jgi:hypothetical protein